MVIFKRNFELTDEHKRKISEMSGKIMIWLIEGRSICYMAEQLNMEPWQVKRNIAEMHGLCESMLDGVI